MFFNEIPDIDKEDLLAKCFILRANPMFNSKISMKQCEIEALLLYREMLLDKLEAEKEFQDYKTNLIKEHQGKIRE